MNQPKAYGSFTKRGDHTFRKSTYIQWGDSEQSIGACLLLNPGSADFNKINPDLKVKLNTIGKAEGGIKTDRTMEQLIILIEEIYQQKSSIAGRFHIYNLFNLKNPKSIHAIDHFEALVQSGEYDIMESLIPLEELQLHPWLLTAWGVKHKASWTNFERIKKDWLNLIHESKIPTFGKKQMRSNNYYHPNPRKSKDKSIILKELVELHAKL